MWPKGSRTSVAAARNQSGSAKKWVAQVLYKKKDFIMVFEMFKFK